MLARMTFSSTFWKLRIMVSPRMIWELRKRLLSPLLSAQQPRRRKARPEIFLTKLTICIWDRRNQFRAPNHKPAVNLHRFELSLRIVKMLKHTSPPEREKLHPYRQEHPQKPKSSILMFERGIPNSKNTFH